MEKLIAKDLLSIGAVFLRPDQPFTWASGIKSPIYCDNRLTLTAVEVRKHVEAGLAEIVRTKFPEAEVLMGTSTAGIAHAAITATILDMPMGYVRSGQKDHGRGNQIEGKLEKGQKVVVIEDLISTGGSCIEVVNALREAGAEVLGVAVPEEVGPHHDVVKNDGMGYCFNKEGNQVSYRYDIKYITTIDFDRNYAKSTSKALSSKMDEVSSDIDALKINTTVDFEPMFDPNESIEEILESLKE